MVSVKILLKFRNIRKIFKTIIPTNAGTIVNFSLWNGNLYVNIFKMKKRHPLRDAALYVFTTVKPYCDLLQKFNTNIINPF